MLVVLVLAILFDAPLREIANPTLTPNPEKAPWYFAALQELLAHFHPMVAGVLLPGAIIIGLVALPYVDRNPSRTPRLRKVADATSHSTGEPDEHLVEAITFGRDEMRGFGDELTDDQILEVVAYIREVQAEG